MAGAFLRTWLHVMNQLVNNSLRIVQVDDNDTFSQITEILLRDHGFTQPIIHFSCGECAHDYLSKIDVEHIPHVILLDLNMPGDMGGLELLRWVRKNYYEPSVPVYILTSSEEPEDRRQAQEAGATKYLNKTALYGELSSDLAQAVALYNHRYLVEIKKLHGIIVELALQGEYAAEMVILTDVGGRVEWVNEPFVRLFNYALEELLGRKSGMLLQGRESDPIAIMLIHNAIQTVRACECDTIYYSKNGRPYPIHISLGPVFSSNMHMGFLGVWSKI